MVGYMASINDLPAELLLEIFHEPTLSMFDYMRLGETSKIWRELFQNSSRIQERIWLKRDRALPYLRKPRTKADAFALLVVVRQLPATIWNDYQEDLWEMIWRHDHSCGTLSWPRNLIFDRLEQFLHIVNPHFIAQPPYADCRARMPSDMHKSLVFCSLNDLRTKMVMPCTKVKASWESMLISQHLVTEIQMHFELSIRYRGRSAILPELVWHHCRSEAALGEELRMKDLVYGLRRNIEKTFEQLSMYGVGVDFAGLSKAELVREHDVRSPSPLGSRTDEGLTIGKGSMSSGSCCH
ncbi:hypothetical protein HBH98_174350 [Parastagonospora nodorum]|nr:hypothetical protein HBI10_080010 [Parastagonospora nodorum]KAH4108521.1 hypothetical protein HBH46_043040 [Parastagonospora nodorum]KAH4262498.1 hypothetical protein HBI03_107660 [Parastagonospora nodorum]KAH4280842.1 hypothetical protein HBI04_049160 [Parastagonospora nodorum]KAH4300392.1 hypothetical protein HBI02_151330 [Parastagonospora nodorum]